MAELDVVTQKSARFMNVKGDLVVLGGYIDALARAALVEEERPKFANMRISTSIKIASEDELRDSKSDMVVCLNTPLSEHDLKAIVTLDVQLLRNESFSIAIVWETGDRIRHHMGMPSKVLFIDVCPEEEHEKTTYHIGSVLTPRRLSPEEIPVLTEYCRISAQHTNHQPTPPPGQWATIADHLIRAEVTDPEALDLLAVMMHKTRNFEKGLEVSRNLISRFPKDPRGYFRAAAYYSLVAKSSSSAPTYAWKLAMMLYGRALKHAIVLRDQAAADANQEKSHFVDKLVAQALQAILHCARHTEFDGVATEGEIADLPEEYCELMALWSPRVRKAVLRAFLDLGEPDPSTLLSLDSRERMCVYSIDGETGDQVVVHKLPRFFRWITPFRMAVMSTPRSAHDIQLLAALGVHHVVTLTKEEPLPEKWFNSQLQLRISNAFMPVSNYKAPTTAQVDNFFNLFDSFADKTGLETPTATLVHCGGGKGRAGTFIACYLARYGFTATPDELPRYGSTEIIDIVRKMRPGSIETVEQENFISKFVTELWKRAETGGKEVLLSEPDPWPDAKNPRLHVEGQLNPQCKLIVCCGIPGSGKSTFSEALARRAGWAVACQDECGSRGACAAVVSTAMRQGRPVIVDRCNPAVGDRQEWIDMAGLPKSQTLCVFFDYEEGLCLQRANRRIDHPTLEAGRARNAVHSMHKSLQRPSIDERFGGIVTIRSIAEANKLVECFVGQNSNVSISLRQNSRAILSSSLTSSSSSVCQQRVSKVGGFYKFPRTRHLMNFGSATRDDLIMTGDEADAFLRSEGANRLIVTFEEKVDGANMGFSIDPDTGQVRAQNRSHYVTSKTHPQFKKLDIWISNHLQDLMTVLNPGGGDGDDQTTPAAAAGRYILFGEWLQATHSIRYTQLPDFFLAFDVYDAAEDQFWSRERLEKTLSATSIHSVPRIPTPEITEDVFQHLMNRKSYFYDGLLEGVYVRRDMGPFLLDRAKVVRKDFISGNTHWSKHITTDNVIQWHS